MLDFNNALIEAYQREEKKQKQISKGSHSPFDIWRLWKLKKDACPDVIDWVLYHPKGSIHFHTWSLKHNETGRDAEMLAYENDAKKLKLAK